MPEVRAGRHRSVDAVVTVNGLPEPTVGPGDPGQVLMSQVAAEVWPHRAEIAGQVLATLQRGRRRARVATLVRSVTMQLLGLALIVLALLDQAPPELRLLSGWPLVGLLVVGGALVIAGPLVARRSTPPRPTHSDALVEAMHTALVRHPVAVPQPRHGADGS